MKFKQWFRQRVHRPHDWTDWEIVNERLVGPYGVTIGPTNQRKCKNCGVYQRTSIRTPDEKCDFPQS